MHIPSLLLPRFTVDYNGSDINGRYYMLQFQLYGEPRYVVYDTEEQKFYDWDSSLTLIVMKHLLDSVSLVGHYSSNIEHIDIYIYEKELIKLFSEDVLLSYGLEHLIKGAERAILEFMI